jgi:probable phosphomutase (TIGR03848 family)
VTLVLLARHGLTAATGSVLTGWTSGIPLDDRGQRQARDLGARLAPVRLDAIITSPLERCRQTAAAVAAAGEERPAGTEVADVVVDERFGECHYGDWTGQPLKRLAREPLWRVVQAHPAAARFPGDDGESFLDMQHRAVSAIRDWNSRLGPDAVYLVCSHGDVIKSIIADSLGLHIDMLQRIQVDPASLTAIRYTPLRPFLLRMNDTGGTVDSLVMRKSQPSDPKQSAPSARSARREAEAAVGGGAGG